MKKVLIIRSANDNTIDKLINYIKIKEKNVQIYMLLQQNLVDMYREKYLDVCFFEIRDVFFNYKKFKKNIRLKNQVNSVKYDVIYIPSSTNGFYQFEEIFLIASSLSAEKYYLFDSESNVKQINLKNKLIKFKNGINKILYIIKKLICIFIIILIYIFYYPYNRIKHDIKKY